MRLSLREIRRLSGGEGFINQKNYWDLALES
jgi:hypothetical protein